MGRTLKRISNVIGPVEHLPSKVAAHITREIADGRLNPGDKLPSENELASHLGISRNVVREAVAQLRADGVVYARQGRGTFVMAPEERLAIRLDPETLKDGSSLQSLFELRNTLETEAAGLAAERCTPGDLEEIKTAVERMSGVERWEDGSIEADLVFHRTIAKATGNPYIHTFVSFICDQIRRSIHLARYTNPLHELVEINVAEHVVIYEAIAAGDPEAARSAMQNHIFLAGQRIGITANTPSKG